MRLNWLSNREHWLSIAVESQLVPVYNMPKNLPSFSNSEDASDNVNNKKIKRFICKKYPFNIRSGKIGPRSIDAAIANLHTAFDMAVSDAMTMRGEWCPNATEDQIRQTIALDVIVFDRSKDPEWTDVEYWFRDTSDNNFGGHSFIVYLHVDCRGAISFEDEVEFAG